MRVERELKRAFALNEDMGSWKSNCDAVGFFILCIQIIFFFVGHI